MKKISSILFCFLIGASPLWAQDVQMADTMRQEGKIYVVVAIVLVILLGLIAFLLFTDRKISRLEKKLNK
ncbi:MAG: CcmD family protein [Bacteroidetes bacterium]|nr:CcmD family protein [Bacteroidota bacterium]